MAGKTIRFDELINSTGHGCSIANSEQCFTIERVIRLLELSQNAYISPDGRKFWPDPTSSRYENRLTRYSDYQIIKSESLGLMPYKHSIVSMGSCFMNEINKRLISDKLLMVKPEAGGYSPHLFPASWGTVFNPMSAQYALELYFDERSRPEILWRSSHNGEDRLYDVFREDVAFATLDEFRRNQKQHILNSRDLLRDCKAFVCAFSMTETWLTNDGNDYPLARAPWKTNPLLARPHTLTFADVVSAVSKISQIIYKHNKDCRIFIGVDPVPLHATHSHKNCIVADSNAKATLISGIMAAIEQSGLENLCYVPFYESIHYCTTDPWSPDERHLNDDAISNAYKELISLVCGSNIL